ncbi:Flp family type IVb pilin [Neisseriaceae bacterium JH1-16]|nr:Flp family type IVb pilin [Neisseriaceae bacterium JH1-16]
MKEMLKKFIRDERGVSALEYGLIAGLIVVGLVAVVPALSTKINAVFTAITAAL